jgi:citrate lyase subunit beta/citryl-CoA lyase|tara:strand:+ start:3428 stop:4069 length:642 start_codon:yes stop_codon:yes gene_type:complete
MKYRSVLFVPGHEEKKIKKAYTLNADLIVLDLESTVPDNQKENAKKIIQNCSINKNKTYIRINSNDDLEFVTKEKFIGIFLPFSESIDQLTKLNNQLKKLEQLKTDIIPIIESQKGIANLEEINSYKERIKIISFGSHDLAKSINLNVSEDEKEILEYRKAMVKCSTNPIDTSYLNFKDLVGFEKSTHLAKQLGFGGKACIHPDQIGIANKIF